jgi:hypothetical protein
VSRAGLEPDAYALKGMGPGAHGGKIRIDDIGLSLFHRCAFHRFSTFCGSSSRFAASKNRAALDRRAHASDGVLRLRLAYAVRSCDILD